jgi:2-dehydro-3-deoxyglucarate aldolase
MIETPDAVESVDEIMAVDGLDFVLFGPADYAMSFGWRRTAKESPEIQDALRRTIEAARKVGKHVQLGVGIADGDVQRYREMGVTMLELACDLAVLRGAWGRAARSVRPDGG